MATSRLERGHFRRKDPPSAMAISRPLMALRSTWTMERSLGLLGPNGAGKSTLIRMMTTLTPVTSGRAVVSGHDVSREPDAVRRTIGVIPQALTSDIDLTVEENLSDGRQALRSSQGRP